MPVWTHYFAHFVVAVIATISFGITFQMPRRHYLACGLTGAVGWMVYIFGVELFALSPAIATLVATLPLTGCARFFAIRHKAPVTIFLLPGIFPLVPGAGIYYTAYYFLQGEQELFASKGGETFKVALALALGIGLQNIPEGAAVSLPLLQNGESRKRAFGAGLASGLVEPLGALLALALAGWVQAALPWLMSAAAGCMVCVTAQEMIPEAVEADEPAGVISVVLGFALMMALDVAL